MGRRSGRQGRPVVILTRERFISRLHAVLVAPVPRRYEEFPTEVVLGADEGLDKHCAANVFTLGRDRLQRRVGRLGSDRHEELCQAYRFAAGCCTRLAGWSC